MKLDWNDLRVFLALERGASARAAAAQLGTSHSTVLRRLQALEDALNAQLFDRTPEGFVLTGPGERLLVKAQQIEAEVFDVQREIAGSDIELEGPVKLTAPPAVLKYLLLPMLAEFQERYPGIDLEVASTDSFADLDRRDADLAIRFSNSPDEHLVGRRLPEFHDAIYVSKDADPSDLSLGWVGWPDRRRFQERIASTPYSDRPIAWQLPGLELQAEAVRQGRGIGLLPCIMGDQDQKMKRMDADFTQPTLPAWLLQHQDLRRLERVRVFADFIFRRITTLKDKVSGR
ncbi:LysR family transcriptional regulator [Marivita hallyeonensis]|uniref:Transcriptional regulator, LysR family n=1 Tax=Marivita hallyeonensis TaxID=996342 RepID=A0A1M5N252_9RHOB|nr:LysR family transcriptional regulator [Marivita hallyeonensis]SHG83628.1 transcriptional regulator, LysR family [Marivita hallyeonensis]